MRSLRSYHAPNLWLYSSVGSSTHLVFGEHGFKSHWCLNQYQTSLLQLLEITTYLGGSFLCFFYRSFNKFLNNNCHNLFSFTFTHHIPSSIVLCTSTGLFGPSPSEVKANTWNSYSVYLSSPVTFLLNVDPLLIVKVVADPTEPFFL